MSHDALAPSPATSQRRCRSRQLNPNDAWLPARPPAHPPARPPAHPPACQAIEYGMIDKVLTTPMPKMPSGPKFNFNRQADEPSGLVGL